MATTPYMGLTLPDVNITTGPLWATELNTALSSIDSHNHVSGAGATIPTSALLINADLTFGNFNATTLRSVRFVNGSVLNQAADLGCIYESGGNFYFNNSVGFAVQITSGSGLNGSSLGAIGGDYGTSTASEFYTSASKTFTFWQSSNTPAKIDIGDLLIRNISTPTNAITFKVPASLGAAYNLTLPTALPSITTFVGSDNAGNLSFTSSFSSVTLTLANLTVNSAATVGTTLGVTGASTLTGAVTCGSTLGVTGATTLSATLGVTGAITGSSTISGTTLALSTAIGSSTPAANTLYKDLMPKGWADTNGSDGSLNAAVNLTCSRASAGTYNYTLATGMANTFYVVHVQVPTALNATGVTKSSGTAFQVTIRSISGGTLTDVNHMVLVFGAQ